MCEDQKKPQVEGEDESTWSQQAPDMAKEVAKREVRIMSVEQRAAKRARRRREAQQRAVERAQKRQALLDSEADQAQQEDSV